MRVVIVGPTHPYKGGIAQHTTELAHRLSAAGHEVDLWSWSEQYPQRLYPGQQRVPDDAPELPVHPRTTYPLSWRRPDGWGRAGRRMAAYDVAVVVVVTPVQAPAYLTMLATLRRRTRVIALCHNVLPHERGKADLPLTKAVLRRADALIVHSDQERQKAEGLTRSQIVVTPLPPLALTVASDFAPKASKSEASGRLLFFGMVRKYKGLDVLLEALAQVPDVSLTVAGEFWEDEAQTRALIERLGLGDRVEVRSGYVAAAEVPDLFAGADALALPYRASTASAHAYIAHSHGIPVVGTTVGSIPEQV
ncbi:MAG TPA: glycosyltransferase family 4 protein, partial [Mycobacteriales bacterium]|nr:glycosyltransferase family 4 protein [Mycobacteriales bacterium]